MVYSPWIINFETVNMSDAGQWYVWAVSSDDSDGRDRIKWQAWRPKPLKWGPTKRAEEGTSLCGAKPKMKLRLEQKLGVWAFKLRLEQLFGMLWDDITR